MVEQFRKLSPGRRLIVVAGVLFAPVMLVAPVMFAFGRVFEGGQRFGIIVTAWTLAGLAVALAWKAAK